MLHLAQATDPVDARRRCAHIDEILLDHAHCEKKAASTAISLIFRYPERPAH
jgi:tRNA-(ms[2]io[6]A)-hydroxylase